MTTNAYDAIIVGASFAGLAAVARQLRGRILLLDRHEMGEVQMSACGTPLWVPETLSVERSVLQGAPDGRGPRADTHRLYDISDVPYCTFDYRTFCRGLLEQTQAPRPSDSGHTNPRRYGRDGGRAVRGAVRRGLLGLAKRPAARRRRPGIGQLRARARGIDDVRGVRLAERAERG